MVKVYKVFVMPLIFLPIGCSFNIQAIFFHLREQGNLETKHLIANFYRLKMVIIHLYRMSKISRKRVHYFFHSSSGLIYLDSQTLCIIKLFGFPKFNWNIFKILFLCSFIPMGCCNRFPQLLEARYCWFFWGRKTGVPW